MTLPVPLIDHAIINARDGLDAAADRYAQLGFMLTPRGHHTLGSINNLAILGTDYIELLGVPPGQGRDGRLGMAAGLNGLVFKTTDSDAVYAAVGRRGAARAAAAVLLAPGRDRRRQRGTPRSAPSGSSVMRSRPAGCSSATI